MEDKINYIIGLLKDKGYKTTDTRLLIIKMFLKNPNKHFSPQDFYDYLRKKNKNVGIATVYRNIKLLKNNNIIEEIILGDKKLYELKMFAKKSVHAHFTCNNCKKLIDCKDVESSIKLVNIIEKIEKEYDFNIKKVDFLLSGICKTCNK